MAGERKQYTAQCKQEALRSIEAGGPSQTARQLGMNRDLLATWRRRLAQPQAASRRVKWHFLALSTRTMQKGHICDARTPP